MATPINMKHHYNNDGSNNCSCLPPSICNAVQDYGGVIDQQRHHHHQPTTITRTGTTTSTYFDNTNEKDAERIMMKHAEDLLASELNKLSVQERTEALEDVHCVGEELKETPEMIEKALADFAVAVVVLLMKEGGGKYEVYETALQQNRAYVEDDSFRLKFLRFNFYNVEKSVRQMMRFLQIKATYFGKEKVARDITLDDLNEEDMEVLQSGMWHVQDGRDRSGRVIFHMFSNMKWKVENLIRASYLMMMNILSSEVAVQTKGVVEIFHNVARTGQKIAMPEFNKAMQIHAAASSFPLRRSTTHYCLHHQVSGGGGGGEGNNNMHYNSFLWTVLKAMPLYETVRSRIHVGHSMEIQYQLPAHGIPLESFPVDMDGKIREDIFFVWFDKYKQAERNEVLGGGSKSTLVAAVSNEIHHSTSGVSQQVPMGTLPPPHSKNISPRTANGNVSTPSLAASDEPFVMAPSATYCPSENDVLLGRGLFTQSWPGNVKFREFIEKNRADYDRLPRTKRQKRTIELIQVLVAKGVRFFHKDETSGEWVEADQAQARLKVSTTFRTLRKGKAKTG